MYWIIRSPINSVEDFLRARGAFSPRGATTKAWVRLVVIIVCGASLYGAVMGSFDLSSSQRLWQVVFGAIKTPLLLIATGAVCLPGFFVLNTTAGLREDFGTALKAILAGQAAVGLSLAALSPLTLVWYASNVDYRAALLFNATMFAMAALAGQIAMRREYRLLIARNRLHRRMLIGWAVLYSFVGIQMGWMLRPFIGDPDIAVSFFRPEPFTNAYIVMVRLVFSN